MGNVANTCNLVVTCGLIGIRAHSSYAMPFNPPPCKAAAAQAEACSKQAFSAARTLVWNLQKAERVLDSLTRRMPSKHGCCTSSFAFCLQHTRKKHRQEPPELRLYFLLF